MKVQDGEEILRNPLQCKGLTMRFQRVQKRILHTLQL